MPNDPNWVADPLDTDATQAKIISSSEHAVLRPAIDPNAIEVIEKLHAAGHQAYLVGGGIRDLLLDLQPKDFDVSTSARPEEIVRLFRKSRMIGRRFKIVHVYFGRAVIEVSTFRGHHPEEDKKHPHAVRSATGQLLRDNIYGSLEEDALRRDFTSNSLYYDIRDETILDFAGGYQDIKDRLLKMLGNPERRYQEDPVRLLRAIRFASKLDFRIDDETAQPINRLGALLEHVPPARLYDEILKILFSGYGHQSYLFLQQFALFKTLFPQTQEHLNPETARFIGQALKNTDKRLANNQGITPAFFFAVVLWPPLKHRLDELCHGQTPSIAMLHQASEQVISRQVSRTAIPRRFTYSMRDIWELQLRLPKRQGQRAIKLVEHPRFRAAYDFLLLREECGEDTQNLGEWWTQFQAVDSLEQEEMIAALRSAKGRRRRRRGRRSAKPRTH